VLLLPVDHPLAARASVTLEDFEDEPQPQLPDPEWNAFWRVDPRPDGRPAPAGPVVAAIEDKIELIAAGEAVAIVPGGMHAKTIRPNLTTVPIEGIEPSHVVLAIRAGDRNRLLADFRKAAEAHLRAF
jgi:DNA-binding transcriptional LysR family regulator